MHFIDESFSSEESTHLLLNCLNKDRKVVSPSYVNYFNQLFDLLEYRDLEPHLDRIMAYALDKPGRKNLIAVTNLLAKYVDKVTPRARELVNAKTVDERIVGALILQHSEDPKVQEELMELVSSERSDDTRDVILYAIADLKFNRHLSHAEVLNMIDRADSRRKLSRWSEKLLDEEALPKLYWKENGAALTDKQVRFIFYRFKRAKGINSDIEARQVIAQLDTQKSKKFALALTNAFEQSGFDTKFKSYLVMAGMIGKDHVLDRIHTIFRKTMTNKRYQMAASIVGAMAIIGSDRALRIVDMLARKYVSKRKQVSKSAIESLEAAAAELDITMEQLADRIIPDFGFEDHYKTIEAGGDTYRAFVSKDFKLNYFNEDNKLRKSIPKDTPKEVTAELKEIEKEIKHVVKTQAGRLEGYLISERKWGIDEWLQYYKGNPIMLIYVQRLLWGLYKDDKLIDVFYCEDDLELYNVDDDEIVLDEGTRIGIVHPLHMTEDLRDKWKQKLYDEEFELEFPIVDREVTYVPEEEKEGNYTKVLFNQEIPRGADYVAGFLAKRGWIKSTADGGRLEFTKRDMINNVTAYPQIEGPMAYYLGGETEASIFNVDFIGKNWQDKIVLGDISPVFFSEVIADLKALINA